MSMAENTTPATTASSPETAHSGARILQFRQALHDKTAAVSGWASEKAGSVREKAAERPLAAAGVSAGAAFVGGLAIGLLLAGRLGAARGSAQQLANQALPLINRARSRLKI